MTNLTRFDLTHTVRCNYPCKQLFHDRGKYMRHASLCNFAGANTYNRSLAQDVSTSYFLRKYSIVNRIIMELKNNIIATLNKYENKRQLLHGKFY